MSPSRRKWLYSAIFELKSRNRPWQADLRKFENETSVVGLTSPVNCGIAWDYPFECGNQRVKVGFQSQRHRGFPNMQKAESFHDRCQAIFSKVIPVPRFWNLTYFSLRKSWVICLCEFKIYVRNQLSKQVFVSERLVANSIVRVPLWSFQLGFWMLVLF